MKPARSIRHWTAAEDAEVCRRVALGETYVQIAAALGRTYGSASGRINDLALGDRNLDRSTKERVVELAAAGATIGRIARKTGLREPLIERLLARAGLRARTIRSYPNAGLRYGAHMPYPAPRLQEGEAA